MEESFKHSIDEEAYEALSSLPANPFHRYIEHDSRRAAFEQQEFETNGHTPLFTYREASKLDVAHYLARLQTIEEQLPKLCHHEPIVEDLYRGKIDELRIRAALVKAVQAQDDESVTALSEQLFSPPVQTREELEKELSTMIAADKPLFVHKKTVSRDLFLLMLQTILSHYEMTDWRIGSTKGLSVRLKHGHPNKQALVLVPDAFQISKNRAIELLTHEIEVHALRTHNGRLSPFLLLGRGLDRYIDTEEGLAIHMQRKWKTSETSHLPGFWDAYATVLTMEYSFKEVYETLRIARTTLARKAGHIEPERVGRNAAWRLCMRAYRGIHQTSKKGVGYRRDHIYRSGLLRMRHALAQDPLLIDTLFQGNMGLQHVERVKQLNLSTSRAPEWVSKAVVQSLV